jgi:hypothetical protein
LAVHSFGWGKAIIRFSEFATITSSADTGGRDHA